MACTEPVAPTRRTVRRTRVARAANGWPARTGSGADPGFTMIELLVVMLIIGILAAVSIPVFLGQRKKAVDTQMKTDLRTAAVQIETYYTDTSAYPVTSAVTMGTGANSNKLTIAPVNANSSAITIRLADGDTIAYSNPARSGASSTTYCLVASRISGSGAGSQSAWVYASDQGGLQPAGTTTC